MDTKGIVSVQPGDDYLSGSSEQPSVVYESPQDHLLLMNRVRHNAIMTDKVGPLVAYWCAGDMQLVRVDVRPQWKSFCGLARVGSGGSRV